MTTYYKGQDNEPAQIAGGVGHYKSPSYTRNLTSELTNCELGDLIMSQVNNKI